MRRIPAYLVALLAGLGIPAIAQDDEDGGGFLERKLEEVLSGEGRDVSITGFRGALSSNATIERMTFSDADGTWLRIEDVDLVWTRTALLRGRVAVDRLTAGEIEFARPPLPANELPSAEAPGFSLPELPVSVNIGELAAERVILGEALFGSATELTVEGTLSLDGGEGSGRIGAERLDGASGTYAVEGNYSNQTEVLTVNASVDEAAGGMVSTLVGLPGTPSLGLTIAGTGPLSDFAADLTLATDGVERVSGNLEILETGADSTDTGFRLNLAGDVAPLVFPEYQAFFGPDIALAVSGAKRGDGSLGIEELSLRAAQVTLSGNAEIGADGLPDIIDLTGQIASADGSPVLLPQGGPPVRIDGADLRAAFDASQSEDWTAEIDIRGLSRPGLEAETVSLDGQGRIAGGISRQVTARLDFAATALDLGDPDAGAALGEDVTGRIAVDWTEGDPVEFSTLTVNGESYGLDGRATLTTSDTGLGIDAEARVAARDLSVFSGLAGRPLAGSVEADVTADASPVAGLYDVTLAATGSGLSTGIAEVDQLLEGDATIDARVRRDETGSHVDAFTARTDAARIEAAGSLTSTRGSAEANVTLLRTDVIAPDVPGPLTVSLEAEGPPDLWDVQLTGDGPGTALSSDLTVDLRGEVPAVSGTLSAALEEISPYSARIGRDVSGALSLTASGSLVTDLTRFDAEAELETTDLVVSQPGVDEFLAGRAQLRADAARDGDTIRIASLTFDSPEASAEVMDATVDLSDAAPSVAGAVSAAIEEIAPLSALAGRDLSGRVEAEASGSLVSDLSRFDLTAAVDTTDLAVSQPGVDDFLVGEAQLRAGATRDGDTIRIASLTFDSPEATAEVTDATVDLSGAAPSVAGAISAAIREIAPLSALAGRNLSGGAALEADGSLVTDLSQFDVTAALDSTDLVVSVPQVDQVLQGRATASLAAIREGDTIDLSAFSFDSAQLEAEASGQVTTGAAITDVTGGAGTANVRLLSAAGILPGMPVPLTANFEADGTPEGVDLVLDVTGDALNISADTRVDLSAEVPSLSGTADISAGTIAPFSELAGRSLSGGIDLTAEGSAQADLQRFDISADVETRNLTIGQADADALLAGTGTAVLRASRQDGAIEVERLDLETDAISLTATGATGRDRNEANFDLRLADVSRWAPGFSGPATASGNATQEGGGDWQMQVSATAPGGTRAEISGGVAPGFDEFDVAVNGSLPLQVANTFISPRAVTGTANFDLRLDGPPELGSLSGRISTADSRFTAPSLGITLTSLGANIDIAGSRAQIDAGANVRGGGSVSVNGPIGLTAPFPADLDVRLNGAVISDPTLYRTTIDGTVSLDGGLAGGATIGGALTLSETEVRIPSGSSKGTGTEFDIVHVNEPGPVRLTRERAGLVVTPEDERESGGGPAYPLNLRISAPNRIFLRGRGLEAELGGELLLGGTTANVVPSGSFELVRGRLDILAQRLELDEGTATLQGDFNPYVRLVANSQRDDTLIKISVDGPAASPGILFESEPELPEDEVLARLLFGRGIDSLSPLQAAQLASAVATLAGRGGDSIVGRIRQKIGLDDLDVTTDEDGDVGLRAGKYLSDDIYSDVSVDNAGEAEVSINLDLTESFTVRGTVGNDGETGVGVFFERDY